MTRMDRRLCRRTYRRNRRLVALGLALGLVWATPARAGIVISAPNDIPATAGTSMASFDVSLTVTGTERIGAFQFKLDLPDGSGVRFVSADLPPANYLFPDSAGVGSTIDNAGLTIFVGDLELNPPGYAMLTDTTVSLGRIVFRLDQGTPGGTVPLTFDMDPLQTIILDDNGSPLDAVAQSGSIFVTAAAVPEPSTLLLGIIGGITVATARRWRLPKTDPSEASQAHCIIAHSSVRLIPECVPSQ